VYQPFIIGHALYPPPPHVSVWPCQLVCRESPPHIVIQLSPSRWQIRECSSALSLYLRSGGKTVGIGPQVLPDKRCCMSAAAGGGRVLWEKGRKIKPPKRLQRRGGDCQCWLLSILCCVCVCVWCASGLDEAKSSSSSSVLRCNSRRRCKAAPSGYSFIIIHSYPSFKKKKKKKSAFLFSK